MQNNIKYIFSIVSIELVHMIGGWDAWLTALSVLMAADIIVGIIKAFLLKSDKSHSGGLKSSSMFHGGIKKLLIFILVALGAILDHLISPDKMYIRSAVVAYYIANESLSILENIAACGIPLPNVLYSALDILRKQGESDSDESNSANK